MFDISTIPGGKNADQARSNAAASDVPVLDGASMETVRSVYDELIRPHVHQRW